MRTLVSLAIGALCLGVSLTAEAVPADPGGTVGLVIEQRAPGSLQWDLFLFSAPGAEVGGIFLVVEGFESFALAPGVINLSYADSLWAPDILGEGRDLLIVLNEVYVNGVVLPPLGGVDDLRGLLLGTFVSALPRADSVALLVDVENVGPPAYDRLGNPFPVADVIMRVVPEPASRTIVALIVAAIFANRLRPAQHLAG